ncbi:MAG: PrgI family protein [Patescibacteria group bacterium]|nr:PrgI family protein [Patescibacteria group bacterium]
MQFQVPQFIETEDRIVGPLTLKQFLYVAAGGALCFALFFFLQTVPWILLAFIIMSASVAMAFIQVNGRPLAVTLSAALVYYWQPRFYIWQKEEKEQKLPDMPAQHAPSPLASAKSLIENLREQLNTSKNPLPQREKKIGPSILDQVKSSKERFEMMRKITGEREMARRIDYR